MSIKSKTDRPNALRRQFVTIPPALLAGSVASRWAWAESVAPRQGGVLKAVVTNNASSLNPCNGRIGTDQIYLWTMYDTLVDTDPQTLKARPGLAKSWDWPEEKTLVLHLNEGVKFHDGTPLDAAAVKFNLEYMQNHVRSAVKSELDQIESIEVQDPLTVALHLKSRDVALILALSDRAGMMASPKALQERGEDFDRNPVGCGAMVFSSWEDGSRITVKRNPDYWRKDRPMLDGIEFQIITDPSTGLRSVIARQNDLTYRVPPQNVPMIKRTPNLTLVSDTTIMSHLIYLNTARGPFANKLVRQAFNYALDRDAYARVITGGFGERADLLYPSRHWSYDKEAASRYPHDPERARALLAEAGFPDGIKFEFNHFSDQRYVQRVEVVAAMLKEANIFIGKKNSGSVLQMGQSWREGVGDAFFALWTGRQDPSMAYSQLFVPGGFFYRGDVEHSPELTKTIYESRRVSDQDQRTEVCAHVQRLEREFALCVPLAFEPEMVAHNQTVHGYESNLMGKLRFDNVWKS